jgi:hypothetical protein
MNPPWHRPEPPQLTRQQKRARLFDQWVPHFATHPMAMKRIGYSSLYDIVCRMDDVRPGEAFDGIATISSFVLFGRGWFPQQVGKIRPWRNPHELRATA